MPTNLFKNPTLGEFIAQAVAQGAILKTAMVQGRMCRFLSRDKELRAILPNIADENPLPALWLESLCRALKIEGYEHLYLWHGED